MELKKRERSSNFRITEVQLLISLVEKFKYIIENKKTDSVTNKNKESAWRKIESSFNACGITDNIRSWKTLKLKYEGLKKNTRKKSSLRGQQMYLHPDAENPSNSLVFNDVEERVMSICPGIRMLNGHQYNDSISENKFDPKLLRNENPDTVTKGSVITKLDELSTARLELVKFQMEVARREHEFVQEEHKLKMEHLANNEKRKEEIHELLLKKIRDSPGLNNVMNL